MENKHGGKNKKGGGKKGKNKGQWKKQQFMTQKFAQDLNGFLFSCDTSQEKVAIRDAYNLLNENLEKIVPNFEEKFKHLLERPPLEEPPLEKKFKPNDGDIVLNADGSRINEESQPPLPEEQKGAEEPKETEESKPGKGNKKKGGKKGDRPAKHEDKAFYNMKVKCKGLLFVKINPKVKNEIDPYELTNTILKDVHEAKENASRYCHRVIPVEIATQADKQLLQKHLEFLVDKYFPKNEDESVTWVINFKSRNNNKFSKEQCIEIIQGKLPKHHRVDYKEPVLTINIEIIQSLMCLSVLKNVHDLKKHFSLHPPGTKAPPPQKKNKAPETKPNHPVPKKEGESGTHEPELPKAENSTIPTEKTIEGESKPQMNEPTSKPADEVEEDEVQLI